jgi:hypothetical protein
VLQASWSWNAEDCKLDTFGNALVNSVDVGEDVTSAGNRMLGNLKTMLG